MFFEFERSSNSNAKNLQFRTAHHVKTRKHSNYYEALDKTLCIYNANGFEISVIHCDLEFRPMLQHLQDELDIRINCVSANEHVPEAERNNRLIKERVRATFHSLPYKALPNIMMKCLVVESANKLNYFPSRARVS